MNLHRASKKPDWDKDSIARRNFFQEIAAKTHGIVTPANIISVIGLGLVIYGLVGILNDHIWTGLLSVAVGRFLDIVDGWVAEVTRTKSLLGEAVDAVVDKLGTLLTIIVLFMLNITPWWVVTALLVPQAAAPVIAFYKKKTGDTPHPTRSGKLSMAMAWAGIVGLFLIHLGGQSTLLLVSVYLAIGLSLLFGLRALWQYATGRD